MSNNEKFIDNLTEEEYRKLLRQERQKDEPDDDLLLWYKYKLGIMPVDVLETAVFITNKDKTANRYEQTVTEIECNSFEEYKKNANGTYREDTRYIFMK